VVHLGTITKEKYRGSTVLCTRFNIFGPFYLTLKWIKILIENRI